MTYERTVSGLLDWVMTEAETFAREVTTRGDKGVEDHIQSCEVCIKNFVIIIPHFVPFLYPNLKGYATKEVKFKW